jgi:tetratricopeptide (TPR) repeat protein
MVMSEHTDEKNVKSNWREWAQGASVVSAFGGTLAAAITQQVLFASVPLSLAAALSFMNRRQLQTDFHLHRDETNAVLSKQVHQYQNEIKNLMHELIEASSARQQQFATKMDQSLGVMGDRLGHLSEQYQILQETSTKIEAQQVELLSSTFEDGYCRRGLEHEKQGEFKQAIMVYSEALRLNPEYAQAYMYRGSAYSKANQKQQAIADLRTAAKLFFETGDLENYHKARAISEEVHGGSSVAAAAATITAKPSDAEPVSERLAVDELFA